MYSTGYRLDPQHYRNFLLKRIIRLDPPYLTAVLISICLAFVSAWMPGYRGAPPHISLPQVLCHLAYLNVFFNYGWLNPVFWSLAIEFQFYLVIGLVLPALAARNRLVRLLGMLGLASLSLIPAGSAFVSHYIFLFIMGMVAFQHRTRAVRTAEALSLLGFTTVGLCLISGPAVSTTALATAVVIMFLEWRNPVLSWLGNISYSLYLVHVPLGGRVVNLGARFTAAETLRIAFLAIALMASIGSAYIMFRFIERPAQKWAKAVRFRQDGPPVLLRERVVACE